MGTRKTSGGKLVAQGRWGPLSPHFLKVGGGSPGARGDSVRSDGSLGPWFQPAGGQSRGRFHGLGRAGVASDGTGYTWKKWRLCWGREPRLSGSHHQRAAEPLCRQPQGPRFTPLSWNRVQTFYTSVCKSPPDPGPLVFHNPRSQILCDPPALSSSVPLFSGSSRMRAGPAQGCWPCFHSSPQRSAPFFSWLKAFITSAELKLIHVFSICTPSLTTGP